MVRWPGCLVQRLGMVGWGGSFVWRTVGLELRGGEVGAGGDRRHGEGVEVEEGRLGDR